MATIATLVVKLLGDTTDFKQKMDKSGEALEKIGEKAKKGGLIMTAGITAPLVALGAKSLLTASDVEESLNKVNVVFGRSSKEVVSFTENAASALGMSQQQALEAAGTYGNLFTSMGIGRDTAADMSTELLTLSADLASFNNIDPTVALEKLRAGLTGETEPLKSLGVNLNAAMVETKALEMGLIAEGEALTAAAKAQASFALIMEQTTNAQGDFANTSDGLANSMRITSALTSDLSAIFGQNFLPIGLQVVTFLKGLLTSFQQLTPEQQKMIITVLGIAAAIGPLLLITGHLITAIGAIIPVAGAVVGFLSGPLVLVIGLIIGVIALLALAWKNNWGGIQEKTKAVVEFIKNLVSGFLALISSFWNAHSEEINTIVSTIVGRLKAVFGAGLSFLSNLIQGVLNFLKSFWSAHGAAITASAQRAWALIRSIISGVLSIISSIIKAFAAAARGDWRAFGEHLRTAWDNAWRLIKNILGNAKTTILNTLSNLIQAAKDKFTNTDWGAVGRNIIQGIANGITGALSIIADAAKNAAKAAFDAAKGFLGIESPSKAFMELGQYSIEGFIAPFSNKRLLERASETMGSAIMRPLQRASFAPALANAGGPSNTYHITGNYRYESEQRLTDKMRLYTRLNQ